MGQWLECIREQLKLKPVTGQADTLWEIFWLWMTFTNVRAAKNQSYLLKDSHKVTCIRIRNSDFVIVIIIIIIIMMIGSREFLEFLRNCSILIIIAIVFSIISLIISRGSWFGETRWSGWHVSGAQPDICASSACYGDGDDDCDLLGNWLTENTNPWLWFLFVCPSPTSQVPKLTLQKRVGEPDDVMLMMEIIIQDQPSEWDWESQESWRSAPGIKSKRWIFFMDPRWWEGFMNKSFMNCSCCTGRIDVAFPPRHPAQYLGFTPTWCSWAVLARYRRPVSRFKSLELRWTGLK